MPSTCNELCEYYHQRIPINELSQLPLTALYVLSFLVERENLQSFVEVGSTTGRSFFPSAAGIAKNGGFSYAIDRYGNSQKILPEHKESLNSAESEVELLKREAQFAHRLHLVKEKPAVAAAFFRQHGFQFDLLHINFLHDSYDAIAECTAFLEMIRGGGFVAVSDTSPQALQLLTQVAEESWITVLETPKLSLFQVNKRSALRVASAAQLAHTLGGMADGCEIAFERLREQRVSDPMALPIFVVGVLTYNQVNYVEECLDSLCAQVGPFRLKVVIADDCSTDGTSELIEAKIKQIPDIEIQYFRHKQNKGISGNLEFLLSAIGTCDFFSILEGDDYYCTAHRVAKHQAFLAQHPQAAIAFNTIDIYYQDEQRFERFYPDEYKYSYATADLARENVIGNLGACSFPGRMLQTLTPALFSGTCYDWLLNMHFSQFGACLRIDEVLSIYRKHRGGAFAGLDDQTRYESMLSIIERCNRYFNFYYDAAFEEYKRRCIRSLPADHSTKAELLILDDAFPHPHSGFRFQEYVSLLQAIPGAQVHMTGDSLSHLGEEPLDEWILQFKQNYPNLSGQVFRYRNADCVSATMLYYLFLGNAGITADIAERLQIPFMFTLYPGGMFGLNNATSDHLLARVCSSPMFHKVIVTQQITYDYLIDKGFCTEAQIEFIFGVVVPQKRLGLSSWWPRRRVKSKSELAVCFVAHKYTPGGVDKGYDVFIEAAKRLSKRQHDICFSVVGPYSAEDGDVSEISNICFYGPRSQDWFDTFYREIDIIVSPNVPGKIFQGSFDGFPTGSVTEASLRGVAMFCTDCLGLNQGRFRDGHEIVLIEPSAEDIVSKIEYYLTRPRKLARLAHKGRVKTQRLYSEERQIAPRISLFKQEIAGVCARSRRVLP